MVTSSKPDKIKPPTYNKIELSRGWRILRQHVNLDVDIYNRTLSGSTSITLCVLNHSCCKIALNLRRCSVSSVRINSHPCNFELVSPLDDSAFLEAMSDQKSRHRVRDVEFSLLKREEEARRCPELLIPVPAGVSADCLLSLGKLYSQKDADAKSDAKPESKSENVSSLDTNIPPPVSVYELPLIQIDIDYNVLDPNAGAIFYGNRSDESHVRDPMYMLTDSRFGMARFWMPCVDSPEWCDRYLFDFHISVQPRFVVIASGELEETSLITDDKCTDGNGNQKELVKKMYKYRCDIPAHASEIVLAVGSFIAIPDPVLSTTVTHFCLPGHAHELVFTGPALFSKAFAFCKDYFGADPPTSSVKQLFLGSTGRHTDASLVGAGGILIHSADLLHTERCIDEGLAAREAIMKSIVRIYLGRFLRPRTSEDGWLIAGLAAHVAALGLQVILGRNWYKFHIYNLMEDLRKERSCDLSNAEVDRLSDPMLDSVRRRSHIILYMIERRIGGDVLKRALRDIIAEGKKAISVLVKNLEQSIARPVILDHVGDSIIMTKLLPAQRELKDLCRDPAAQGPPSAAVSSGFDEAVQGVAVGPFLKRLRAICGTDVRSMVRLWASSPGIPRMEVGYQYNPRKHTIEIVVKQEPPTDIKKGQIPHRPTLQFHGSISIRVMEADGAYDHSLEITDLIFATEIVCHSRRKAGKGGGTEETNPNAVTQASPLSWIRFDPENEWCKEVSFKQHESSWASVLEGDRDGIGQLEACRGLKSFTSEPSAKRLLFVVRDEQAYWEVRAEAASILAGSMEGLKMLMSYFQDCYADGEEEGGLGTTAHLRPNNFSNIANYFVKRAMIRAIATSRVKGSRSTAQPNGSIPREASQFLCSVLAGHDNTGNQMDDDHYVVELFKAVTDVAVNCVGDEIHAKAGEGESSTTDTIIRQLEQFRSLERMVQRRTSLVPCALSTSLGRIELAKMTYRDKKEEGRVSLSLRSDKFSPNVLVLKELFTACRRGNCLDDRLSAILEVVNLHGGSLDVALWALSYVDRTSGNGDIISLRHSRNGHCEGTYGEENWEVGRTEHEETRINREKQKISLQGKAENGEMVLDGRKFDFLESPLFRYRLLDALFEAISSKQWYSQYSPLLLSIRSYSRRAIEFCVRLQRLIVGDADPRVRASAAQLAKRSWGIGIPACLLSLHEYKDAKCALAKKSLNRNNDTTKNNISSKNCKSSKNKSKHGKDKKRSNANHESDGHHVVPMLSHGTGGIIELQHKHDVEVIDLDTDLPTKSKGGKTKAIKNGKSRKKDHSDDLPPKMPGKSGGSTKGIAETYRDGIKTASKFLGDRRLPSTSTPSVNLIVDDTFDNAMGVPVLSTEPHVKNTSRRVSVVPKPPEVNRPIGIPKSEQYPSATSLSPPPQLSAISTTKPRLKSMPVSALKPPLKPSSSYFSPPRSLPPSQPLSPSMPSLTPLSPPLSTSNPHSPQDSPSSFPLSPPSSQLGLHTRPSSADVSAPPTPKLSSKPWSNKSSSLSKSTNNKTQQVPRDNANSNSHGIPNYNPSHQHRSQQYSPTRPTNSSGVRRTAGSSGDVGRWASPIRNSPAELVPQEYDKTDLESEMTMAPQPTARRDRNRSRDHREMRTSKPGPVTIPRSVAVGATDSRAGGSIGSASQVVRSIPQSARGGPGWIGQVSGVKASWHPMDEEDKDFFVRAWQETRRVLDDGRGRERPTERERSRGQWEAEAAAEASSVHARERDRDRDGDRRGGSIHSGYDGDGVGHETKNDRFTDNGEDMWKRTGGATSGDYDYSVYTGGGNGGRENHDVGDGISVGRDGGGESDAAKKKKKKKKKKRKRESEGGDEEHRKKKKKKKRKKESSEKEFGNDGRSPGRSEFGGEEESQQIRKIQIRIPPRATQLT